MKVWFVVGLVSCSGPSLLDNLIFVVRPYGVFSHGLVGTEMMARCERFVSTVQGSESLVMQSMDGHEMYASYQQL